MPQPESDLTLVSLTVTAVLGLAGAVAFMFRRMLTDHDKDLDYRESQHEITRQQLEKCLERERSKHKHDPHE